MHATHPHGLPRRTLIAGLTALALGAMAVALPSQIADSDLSLGGGGGGGGAVTDVAPAPISTEQPRWVADPLASPLTDLRTVR